MKLNTVTNWNSNLRESLRTAESPCPRSATHSFLKSASKPAAHRRREAGSVLMVVLIFTIIAGTTLASYLHMVSNQNGSVARALAWNSVLPIAEAGIEEALAHLNYNTNRAKDGWVLTGTNYVKSRTIGKDKYTVYISTNFHPYVTAEAWTPSPFNEKQLIHRAVRTSTTNRTYWVKGMVAKGKITFNGGVKTDSYDSTDPALSAGGLYDPTKAGDNGDIASNGIIENIVSAGGGATIYGHVATGPGGSVGLTGNATVGSKAWHANAANTGTIEPGYERNDMNVSFPPVEPPFQGGAYTVPTAINTILGTITYDYAYGPGNFELPEIKMSSSKKIVITGDTTIYVKGDVSLSGQAQIYISPGATLRLYVAGNTAISGQGIMNAAGRPINFQYYGLPSNSEVSFSGNSAFIGTIYAPNANFKLAGGGNTATAYDFMGASTTASVEMKGHYNFHYDESLGKDGPANFYVTTWNEVASK